MKTVDAELLKRELREVYPTYRRSSIGGVEGLTGVPSTQGEWVMKRDVEALIDRLAKSKK